MNHDDDYEPDFADLYMADYGDGNCPCCGARLRYIELFADADVGVERCDDCGYEGGIK